MDWRLGCNTLDPDSRLNDVRGQSGLTAQQAALRILRDAGFGGCEFSHLKRFLRQA